VPQSPSAPLTVHLAGELTIRTIGDAHVRLRDALQAGAPVLARIDPDANADLTFVQLIESARRSAAEADVAFALAAPAAGPLLETLNRGGFVETAGQRAFWLEHSGEP
jgi:hypothetical protein